MDRLDGLNDTYARFLAEVRSSVSTENTATVQVAEAGTQNEDPIARFGPDVNSDHLLISLALSLSHDVAAVLTVCDASAGIERGLIRPMIDWRTYWGWR